MSKDDIESFDISNIPEPIFDDFVENFGSAKYLVYVKIDTLGKDMFVLGNAT